MIDSWLPETPAQPHRPGQHLVGVGRLAQGCKKRIVIFGRHLGGGAILFDRVDAAVGPKAPVAIAEHHDAAILVSSAQREHSGMDRASSYSRSLPVPSQ